MAEIDISIYCDCGAELDVVNTNYTQKGTEIIVTPCENCMDKKEEEGRVEGHSEGFNEGYDEGHNCDIEL